MHKNEYFYQNEKVHKNNICIIVQYRQKVYDKNLSCSNN